MKTVAEYREFAATCRELATRMSDPQDRYGLELQARTWDRVADEREVAIKNRLSPELVSYCAD